MKITPTALTEVLLIEPEVFGDERGFFFESFNQRIFEEAVGHSVTFVQDNHSKSKRRVLRGMHYQAPPFAQGKLVRVAAGEVFNVSVDIRPKSRDFGKWQGIHLSGDNKYQLWIPPGFAHGFLTLSETAEFLYKTTDFYCPRYERCLAWNDPQLKIKWPSLDTSVMPLLSAKDRNGLTLNSISASKEFT